MKFSDLVSRMETTVTVKDAPYKAVDVAKYIIHRCNKTGTAITNLQLQKILYFVSGEIFLKHHIDLIQEDFYAWKLGPVVPVVYEVFCLYGGYPIPLDAEFDVGMIDKKYRGDIDRVVDKYSIQPVWELVEESHQTDPWKFTYEIFGNNSRISKASIKKYFENVEGDQYGSIK